jgi:type IV pilus assembly protein PilA
MTKTLRNRKGFTLIELMIVVAIIGILAAIAIPNFLRFQLKSKSSEGKVNLAAIRTAEESYLAEFGEYLDAAGAPAGTMTTTKTDWNAPTDFQALGWAPEGAVYFQYAINEDDGGYTATATADIDGDNAFQSWSYVQPTNTDSTQGPTPPSGANGNCNDPTQGMNAVSPCVDTHGRSIF